MPMNLEYVGDFFAYYVVAFGALVLTPLTMKKFRSSANKKEEERMRERKAKHGNSKWFKNKESELKKVGASPWITRLIILLCWALLAFIGYNASQTEEVITVAFDPFEILGVSQNDPQFQDFESGKKAIKKVYRTLSRTQHPDKLRNEYLKANDGAEIPDDVETANNEAWGKINKAYETLTDEHMFENWVKYGNPDGMLQE
ncbi:Oidioi.mRNA.OKI2018_I69.PAR.g12406.t1.cds [Oikopleura dioica]|uniref:Oidioi.mRNA.OKI2018_I69.PAR.g12406.t1.cds n=1 Tax=Oikopleura dioica TaxID=34765 RepID=A0ABN7S4H5_OIKDI|nr:Oidioi.mRNA.OKI2018_I69.PAR.g12406.t1.cds [Oikopleura dioica]